MLSMPGVFLSFGLLFLSGILFYVTRSASKGEIPLNSEVGIRTKWTKSSPEAWIAAHKAALPTMLTSSIICIITGVVTLLLSIVSGNIINILVSGGIGYMNVIVCCILSVQKANKSAKNFLRKGNIDES